MLKNYLKTAFRAMLRQKAYAFINVAGLSVGIAATLIIVTYISDELSFDRFHRDLENTYRLGFGGKLQGSDFTMATTPAPIAEAMRREVPEVTEAVRFGVWHGLPVNYQDKSFTEKHVVVADSNFFQFFNFKMIEGDPVTSLKGPNKVILTEKVAKKYFGSENPVGKIMALSSDKRSYEVVGIVADPPTNSHITFDMIVSSESWWYMKDTQWSSNNLYTYYRTQPGADPAKVQSQISQMLEAHIGPELEKIIGVSIKQFREAGNDVGLFSQRFLDIHLTSDLREEIQPNGNIQYLRIFGAIAIFIMLIACINFMNLATARSANRAKEVGIRKTIGAFRTRLIFQFLSESLLYSVISTVLAVLIMALTLTAFNELSGKALDLSVLLRTPVLVSLILFPIVIGIIAGSYPAFYLTSFQAAAVLKGKLRTGSSNSTFRSVLVTFQFVISICLIFGSLVVYRQLNYMHEKSIGFKKDNILDLQHAATLGKNAKPFKDELATHPEFEASSFANSVPPNTSWSNVWRKGGSEQDFLLFVYQVDHDNMAAIGYELKEGRFFSRDFASDTAHVVINEATYKAMGFESLEEAELISYNGDKPHPMKVVGIIKDFNFLNLKDQVKPMVMILGDEPNDELAIRLSPGKTEEQIDLLESLWKKYSPGSPFEYSFVDQNYDALFKAERRMSSIILVFTVLAIGIACLGLFGLATFTAEQRNKEMSIRKVMGASASQVMVLLTRNFVLLILVAFAIAAPMAWYFTDQWLQGFSNRITVGADVVLMSGFAAVMVALVTISFQSVKAARENPIRGMRSE